MPTPEDRKPLIPRGPIGFRLAHELEGLLMGIRADGVIVPDELARLQRWLEDNRQYGDVQPFSEITSKLDAALADGVLTVDECDDLLFVIAKLTTVNPYFDKIRAGLQILMGLLSGVSADTKLPQPEIDKLIDWAEDWRHLQGLWPFDECEAIVTAIATQKRGVSVAHIFQLAKDIPLAGSVDFETGEFAPLVIDAVCAIDPDVTFAERTFVFTGESSRCERSVLANMVHDRGGRTTTGVSAKTDYVVVCEEGNPHWAFACYGRKIEQAMMLRRAGHRLPIVREIDFHDACLSTAPVPESRRMAVRPLRGQQQFDDEAVAISLRVALPPQPTRRI